MTPTLNGRIQTRIFLLWTVGALWTLIVTPLLPRPGVLGFGPSLGQMYRVTFQVLLIVTIAGVVWELIYHGLQQYRWEKDWPALFGLLNGINEGIAAWIIVNAVRDGPVGGPAFVWHFLTTWLVVWVFVNGPIRVVSLRWRFRGGRIV